MDRETFLKEFNYILNEIGEFDGFGNKIKYEVLGINDEIFNIDNKDIFLNELLESLKKEKTYEKEVFYQGKKYNLRLVFYLNFVAIELSLSLFLEDIYNKKTVDILKKIYKILDGFEKYEFEGLQYDYNLIFEDENIFNLEEKYIELILNNLEKREKVFEKIIINEKNNYLIMDYYFNKVYLDLIVLK